MSAALIALTPTIAQILLLVARVCPNLFCRSFPGCCRAARQALPRYSPRGTDLPSELASKAGVPRSQNVEAVPAVEVLMVAVRAALSQAFGPMTDERPRDALARHECC
jgi:hypothetical protein